MGGYCQLQYRRSRWRAVSGLLASILLLAACGLALDDTQRLTRGQSAFSAGDFRAAVIDAKAVLAEDSSNLEARILLANSSFELGDYAAAAFEYGRAVDGGYPATSLKDNWGQALLALGDYATLLGRIEIDDQLTPEQAVAVSLARASAAEKTGDFAAARTEYALAMQFEPGNEAAAVGTAATYLYAGDSSEALRQSQMLLETHPNSLEAQLLSAAVAAQLHQYDIAEQKYRAIVEMADEDESEVELRRAHVGLAEILLAKGDTAAAAQSVEVLSELLPDSPITGYLAAKLDVARGDPGRAIERLEPMLSVMPRNIELLTLLGRARLMQGSVGQADAYLTRAFAQAPSEPEVRALLAEVRLLEGRFDDARSLIEPLLEADGTQEAAAQLMLRIAVSSGRPQDGLDVYQQALESDPNNVDLRLGLAASQLEFGALRDAELTLAELPDSGENGWRKVVLSAFARLRRGDTAGAVAETEQLADREPQNADVQLMTGNLAEAAGRLDIAIERYEKSIEIAPDNESGYLRLMQAQRRAKSPAAAHEAIERGLSALPTSARLLTAMAVHQAAYDDRPEEAILWLEKAREADSAAFAPRLALTQHYIVTRNLEAASVVAEEALQIAPGNAYALFNRGAIDLQLGNAEAAVPSLSAAVDVRPQYHLFVASLAQAYLETGEPDRALEVLSRLDKLDFRTDLLRGYALLQTGATSEALAIGRRLRKDHSANAGIERLIGEAALVQGDFTLAAESLTRAYDLAPTGQGLQAATFARLRAGYPDADSLVAKRLAAEPESIELRRNYAHILASSDRAEDASMQYERILRQDPNDFASLNNLAWIYSTQGRLEEAERMARKAVNLVPRSPQANDTLGWILVQRGEHAEAVRTLREAARYGESDPEIRYHLATALYRSGDTRGAASQLRVALENPANFSAREDALALMAELAQQ